MPFNSKGIGNVFKVEIQATNKTWFIADGGENLTAEEADKMLAELRAQGFTARASFV